MARGGIEPPTFADSVPELTPAATQSHDQRLSDQLLTPPRGRGQIDGTRTGPKDKPSIRRMNRTPGLVNRGFCFRHHPIHTGVGGFIRLPGVSGPRFRARQLHAAQQPGEPRVLAGTAHRLPLWPRFALYWDNPGHLPGRPQRN
jgi:hypothetical protein